MGGCGLGPPTLSPSARPSLRQGNNRCPLFPFDEGGHSTAGELVPAPASWIMVPHGRGRGIPAFGKLVSKPQPPNHSPGLPPILRSLRPWPSPTPAARCTTQWTPRASPAPAPPSWVRGNYGGGIATHKIWKEKYKWRIYLGVFCKFKRNLLKFFSHIKIAYILQKMIKS